MSYTVWCLRCGNAALQRKIDKEYATRLFAVATNTTIDKVHLCGNCVRTIDSMGVRIAKAKKQPKKPEPKKAEHPHTGEVF